MYKSEFTGKYFTGLTSKSFPCSIYLDRYQVKITYDEGNGVFKQLNWELDHITRDDINITDTIKLKFGSYPFQSIEVTDPHFIKSLADTYSGYGFAKRQHHVAISRKVKHLILMTAVLLSGVLLVYQFLLPIIANQAADNTPIHIEKQLGDVIFDQLVDSADIDEVKTELANQFYHALHINSQYDTRITIVKSDMVNAFAIPGGNIVIYDSIIQVMNQYEEFAALIAHESAHIERKHSLKAIYRSLSSYLLISLLTNDVGGISSVIIENAHMLHQLQYSRNTEREADETGINMLIASQINPYGMVWLFESLQHSDTGHEKYISEFTSTHPLLEHRIEDANNRIGELQVFDFPDNARLEHLWNQIHPREDY